VRREKLDCDHYGRASGTSNVAAKPPGSAPLVAAPQPRRLGPDRECERSARVTGGRGVAGG
ncbi:MAG TPA: hypothetical protein VGF86_08645, partial [Candidatus Tumulicola sp.]